MKLASQHPEGQSPGQRPHPWLYCCTHPSADFLPSVFDGTFVLFVAIGAKSSPFSTSASLSSSSIPPEPFSCSNLSSLLSLNSFNLTKVVRDFSFRAAFFAYRACSSLISSFSASALRNSCISSSFRNSSIVLSLSTAES